MDISIIGTGYVGLVTGVGLAELEHNVICVDIIKEKVESINLGIPPIFEQGLKELLKENLKKERITATLDLKKAISKTDVTFICVNTPSLENGSTDLGYIQKAAEGIGEILKDKDKEHIVIVKSTVPPGTSKKVEIILEEKAGRKILVGMNPEFLREGNAIFDFMNPDKIVLGADDKKALETMKKIYKNFNCPKIETDLNTAEMIKYVNNSFLATKISFANEIGNICKKLGIDVYEVMDAVGLDKRIERKFLNAGIGYGGSCFPKDVTSLIHTAKTNQVEPLLLNAVVKINEKQPYKLIQLAEEHIGNLTGKKITVLGVAFKPESDDIREAPSIKIIKELVKKKANIIVYDKEALENTKKIFDDKIKYAKTKEEAVNFSNIVFILTEWDEFKDEEFYKGKIVFDGRKVINKKSKNWYNGICW